MTSAADAKTQAVSPLSIFIAELSDERASRGNGPASRKSGRYLGATSTNRQMAKADRPLAEQLDELQAWLRTLTGRYPGDVPTWSRILLGEVSDIDWSSPNRLPTL